MAEGLNVLLLMSLPDLDGVVPDALARAHPDRAAVADRISVENPRSELTGASLGLALILRG